MPPLSGSRKRVRETVANGDRVQALHDEIMHDDDDDYIDVDMDVADPLDEIPSPIPSENELAVFVPYYAHLGGTDFDDQYVSFHHPIVHKRMVYTMFC